MTELVAVLLIALGLPTGEPEPASHPYEAPRFEEPVRIPSRDRRPSRPTTSRFTDRPPLVRPALRLSPGISIGLTERPYLAFGFDALASVMFGLHGGRRQIALAPEIGYSLRAPGGEHQMLVGTGVVWGVNVEHVSIGLLPRAVFQVAPTGFDLGQRTGLWFDFAENGISMELAHQWVRQGGDDRHELRLTVSLDVLMLGLVLSNAEIAWL